MYKHLKYFFLILAKTWRSPRTTRISNPKPVQVEQQKVWRLHLRRGKRATLVLEHQKGENTSLFLNLFTCVESSSSEFIGAI
jgi:hypothetical protein